MTADAGAAGDAALAAAGVLGEDRLVTLAERPELARRVELLQRKSWPVFMWLGHNRAAERCWPRVAAELPQWVLCAVDRGELLAAVHAAPLTWSGDAADLPGGFDGALERAVDGLDAGRTPDTLCALSMAIAPEHRGRGLAPVVFRGLVQRATEAGLRGCIGPVRPSGKHRFVDIPMAEYVRWRREDGLPRDAWIRVHARLGAETLGVAERSMVYTGTVEEWQMWTRERFSSSGEYPIPGGLVRLRVDRAADRGVYAEPNLWMFHRAGASATSNPNPTVAPRETLSTGVSPRGAMRMKQPP